MPYLKFYTLLWRENLKCTVTPTQEKYISSLRLLLQQYKKLEGRNSQFINFINHEINSFYFIDDAKQRVYEANTYKFSFVYGTHTIDIKFTMIYNSATLFLEKGNYLNQFTNNNSLYLIANNLTDTEQLESSLGLILSSMSFEKIKQVYIFLVLPAKSLSIMEIINDICNACQWGDNNYCSAFELVILTDSVIISDTQFTKAKICTTDAHTLITYSLSDEQRSINSSLNAIEAYIMKQNSQEFRDFLRLRDYWNDDNFEFYFKRI